MTVDSPASLAVPTEAPLILSAPPNALEQAQICCVRLVNHASATRANLDAGDYATAMECLKLGDLIAQAEAAIQVVAHGELNVDELVLAKVPRGEWVPIWTMESQLRAWDARLGEQRYKAVGYYSLITPVEAVVRRLIRTGVLRKHAAQRSVKRA